MRCVFCPKATETAHVDYFNLDLGDDYGEKKTVKEMAKSLVQKLSRPLVTWQVRCRSPASGDVTTGDGVVRGILGGITE